MCPQLACLRGCKVTLITFVQLLSTVCFQVCLQMACSRRGIVTLHAFAWLFSIFKCVLKLSTQKVAKSHWLHLFVFSPLCILECVLKLLAWTEAKSHWLHLFDFSPLWIFTCVLKSIAWAEVKSHRLHLFDFFQCASSCVVSRSLDQSRQIHIGCIYLIFLHCASSNVSWNVLY